jgi:hypothetical protein
VGAVDADRVVAPFSSHGPSADGRVKPDVAAMGRGTYALSPWSEDVIAINGTSFSSPVLAGAVACLWQLHPDRTAHEVMDAVRRSASRYDQPDADMGHGIPDLWRAHLLLGGKDLTGLSVTEVLNVAPVPFLDHFLVELYAGDVTGIELRLVDMAGREAWRASTSVDPRSYTWVRVGDGPLQALQAGAYVLEVRVGDVVATRRVVKAAR